MDFGFLSLESLVGPPQNGAPNSYSYSSSALASDPSKAKQKLGSGIVKQERSVPVREEEEEEEEDDDWRASKVAKAGTKATMPLSQEMASSVLRSNSVHQEQMLSFSSNKSEVSFLGKDGDGIVLERGSQSSPFPYYQRMPRYAVSGYGSGSLNPTMHVGFSGIRGPFTASQWIELEHQALIYKYLTSNVPVPSNLLLPLKKSLNPFCFPSSVVSSLPPNSFGWGSFHLGFADSSDPEPGRCRRTDGKKWRCSRDAVADQKYCERHINRGRHRSRKPVEGQHQTGHAASKAAPMTPTPSSAAASPALPLPGNARQSNGLAAAINRSADSALVNRMQDLRGGLPVMTSSTAGNLKKPNESAFDIPKQVVKIPPCSTSQPVFGLVSTDSLLNPSQDTSYITSKSYSSSFLDFGQDHRHNPLRHFINECPKDNASRSVVPWPEEIKPEWTQLSMSIPVTASQLSSTPNSPRHDKLAVSPLRLSQFEPPLPMKQANWVPISWGSSNCSMGGPLGEVLTNTSSGNAKQNCRNPSASLNLLAEGWDGSSQLGSSPTGVLQKSTFCSLSNSSTGSSPRADNNTNNNHSTKNGNNVDGTSVYSEVLGSTIS